MKDGRGEIVNVGEGEFRSVQLITSKAGVVRSNHWHRVGGHLLYVVSGRMRYVEKPVDFGGRTELVVSQGESIFTGPRVIHATEFLEDTVLICCATLPRGQVEYEADTVRVKLL